MKENYYLNLLYRKVMELKKTLKELESEEYSIEYKKYLISGYIIALDSILEIGISDLHSQELDELSSLIYYTRQKAVHYGYFNGMHNIEDVAHSIVELTEKNYEAEKTFYQRVLDNSNFKLKCDNIAIKNSTNIASTQELYKFRSMDGTKEVFIPSGKIFTLTKKSKEKPSAFIIDLDNPASLYTIKNGTPVSYEEISNEELKSFFRNNFQVVGENYTAHNETIQQIIHKFISDPLNSIQIMEYASDEQFCRNTIDVIKDFILEKTMFEAYIENHHLIKDKYSLNKMQKTDYSKLQHSFKKNILQFMTQKDAFFVDMTIKRARYYFDTVKDSSASFDFDHKLLSAMLIQLFETGPKHFSKQFISSSPEFKKCYNNLLRYRQVFSHYILGSKEYKDALENFKNEFLGFIKILQLIDLNDVRIAPPKDYETYSLLEREKSDFFNYKHEQFLKIGHKTYIGKKIYYSSTNPESDKLIAIIPYGNNASNTLYYERDAHDYLVPIYDLDEDTGKKTYIHVSKHALGITKEVDIDLNLSSLFKAYSIKMQESSISLALKTYCWGKQKGKWDS